MSPARRLLRVLLALVTLLAFTGGARAEYFCFAMQRTMASCCCAPVERASTPEMEPSIERGACCERRVKDAATPVVRLDGSATAVPKAPVASVTGDPFVVHATPPNALASRRFIDTGPRAGPALALYARTCRYLI